MKTQINQIYNRNGGLAVPTKPAADNFYSGKSTAIHQSQLPECTFDEPLKNNILSRLSEKSFENIFSALKLVQMNAGETISQPQEKIEFVYFPETAVCGEFEILEDGKMIELAMTGREGVTGISAIFDSYTSLRMTQVLQTGNAWRADSEIFDSIMRADAKLRIALGEYLSLYIHQLSQKIICQSFHQTRERLCSWFLMLQDRSGADFVVLTHEQIALSLGTHRPSITQIMKDLRKNRLINYKRGKILLADRQKLTESACECYSEGNLTAL